MEGKYFSEKGEVEREAINAFMRNSKEFDGVIDFDAAVRDHANPLRFDPTYDAAIICIPMTQAMRLWRLPSTFACFRRRLNYIPIVSLGDLESSMPLCRFRRRICVCGNKARNSQNELVPVDHRRVVAGVCCLLGSCRCGGEAQR